MIVGFQILLCHGIFPALKRFIVSCFLAMNQLVNEDMLRPAVRDQPHLLQSCPRWHPQKKTPVRLWGTNLVDQVDHLIYFISSQLSPSRTKTVTQYWALVKLNEFFFNAVSCCLALFLSKFLPPLLQELWVAKIFVISPPNENRSHINHRMVGECESKNTKHK